MRIGAYWKILVKKQCAGCTKRMHIHQNEEQGKEREIPALFFLKLFDGNINRLSFTREGIVMLPKQFIPANSKPSVVKQSATDSSNNRKMRGENTVSEKYVGNNRVCIIRKTVSNISYSHEVYGEGSYMTDILVGRMNLRKRGKETKDENDGT